MELIDKEKVEIILRNLWKEDDGHNSEHRICYNKALQEVQYEIDTLEVIEVDLKEERMKDCPYRVVGCEKYSGTVTECNGACAWVTDYLTLKERKANKGEEYGLRKGIQRST